MTMGRITHAHEAEEALNNRNGDLIGLSRTLLSDSEWGNKIMEGRINEIRPCISCNFCWGEVHSGRPISCVHNPNLGTSKEHDWTPPPVNISQRKRVVVVGGGVAGLEAAWVSGNRGHEVTLFSSSNVLGGKVLLESQLPGRRDLRQMIDYQRSCLDACGVEIKLGEKASLDDIEKLGPDSAVFATGAKLMWPDMLSHDAPAHDVRGFVEKLLLDDRKQNGVAVIFDQDHTSFVYAAAELAIRYFDQVVIITPKTTIASKVNYISVIGVLRRLAGLDVEVIGSSVPVSWEDQSLVLKNMLSGKKRVLSGVTSLAYATPREVNDNLLLNARGRDFNAISIGDCKAPRGLVAALHEGHKIGETI